MTRHTLQRAAANSHKGQNGKVLIVGGSHLFHAASLWSANVAAHIVDMVFYASTRENNHLVKGIFTDGIVVERSKMLPYAGEADVILIGPGLQRVERNLDLLHEILDFDQNLSTEQLESDTYLLTNWLLHRFPQKKWVIDAGALQMIEPEMITPTCILTPHRGERQLLQALVADNRRAADALASATILCKNLTDQVWRGEEMLSEISGGNEGLTKGGSGDVLAGLVAALYCRNDAPTSCQWASLTVKKAAEKLYKRVGPFFTTTQLSAAIPEALWDLVNE